MKRISFYSIYTVLLCCCLRHVMWITMTDRMLSLEALLLIKQQVRYSD